MVIPGMIRTGMLVLLVCMAGTVACLYAEEQNTIPADTTIAGILASPDAYADTNLSLEGKITSQCGSGCWFFLSDDTGDLFVDLKPGNFVIPPSMGKNIIVNGTILKKNGDITFVGKDVTVDGNLYP